MRWLMAWLCYWIGEAAYHCRLWSAHQRCMLWSDWWQGDTDHGPWKSGDEPSS